MGFYKKTIRDIAVDGQTVLVRTDYNVPLKKDGTISDDLRIRASLPTLEYLLKHRAKVVIISHLGRPEGRDASLSLEPAAARLAQLLGRDVLFVDETVGDRVHQVVKRAAPGSVIVLENLRFFSEEEADNQAFAHRIATDTGARYFVQDGFGVVHRAHASTHAMTLEIPSVAGLLLEKEYQTITRALESPKRPFVAIMGGAKVSDKLGVIERFVDTADTILIGGAMANTVLAARGVNVGSSKVESGQEAVVDSLYARARAKVGAEKVDELLRLPEDVAVATAVDPEQTRRSVAVEKIAPDDIALDIGDKAIETFAHVVESAKTVIWNGPVGYSELPEFAHGSARIALALASHPEVTSIVGGGDTADFVLKWDGHAGQSFTHVSTGGGAGLELMAGQKLPGVESLLDATS